MNNGTRKGGSLETFQTLESSPGLEDLWQLHWSHNVMVEHNAPGAFIANIEDNATLASILTAPPPAPRRLRCSRGQELGAEAAVEARHRFRHILRLTGSR